MVHGSCRNIIDIYLVYTVTKVTCSYLDDLVIPISELIHIDVGVLLRPIPRSSLHHSILDDRLVELVDVLLRILHDIKISESPRRILDGEQPADNERILTMFIVSILISWLILTAECELIVHDDSEMQDSLRNRVDDYLGIVAFLITALHLDRQHDCLLVVHVDDFDYVSVIDVVIVQIPRHNACILRSYLVSYLWETSLD